MHHGSTCKIKEMKQMQKTMNELLHNLSNHKGFLTMAHDPDTIKEKTDSLTT